MRIVVVGGVAGGMSAAARARRRDEDAEIIVLERGDHPSFANCGLPYYVSGEIADQADLLVQTPASLKAALALDVRTRHDVTAVNPTMKTVTIETPQGIEALTYDALILAPGARAIMPPIPGLTEALNNGLATTLRTVDDAVALRSRIASRTKQPSGAPQRAVVLGAGFIGVEAAEALRLQGLEVDLIERAPHVLPPLEREMATLVTTELVRLGVHVHDSATAVSIESENNSGVIVLDNGTRLPADLIVLSVGVTPDTAPFEAAGIACERGALIVDEHGHTNIEGIWAVGDATVSTDAVTGTRRPVPLAGPANRAGRLVADSILAAATARTIPPTMGTAIVRVGNLTAASTGANRATLDAAGMAYETIHLHPNHHAGYFPAATPLHLLIHLGCRDGLLLGAQAVGENGVDKRIDVLATALRYGATAPDLIDLDLAYAPPYASAKDPVNLAGMIAENVLDGTVRLWHAAELDAVLASSLILDVRSAAEVASGHLPGALHVPHTEIREHLATIRSVANGRPIRLHCQSGMRSALAVRILTAAGLDAAHLSGGMLTLRAWWGNALTLTTENS